MQGKVFDKMLKLLNKYQGKLLKHDELKKLMMDLFQEEYAERKMYKMVYYLKLRGYLFPIKRNLFLVVKPDQHYESEELAQLWYWEVLNKYCKDFLDGKRYVGGLKALEIALLSYGIPEEILLVTPNRQSTELVLLEKTALLKKYTTKEKNLFSTFWKYTNKITL